MNTIKTDFLKIILALLLGILFSAFLYFSLLGTPPIGYRMLAILVSITLAASAACYFLLKYRLLSPFLRLTPGWRWVAVLFSLITGFFLVFSSRIDLPLNTFLLPQQHLRITPAEEVNALSGGRDIEIRWIYTSVGKTNFALMDLSPDWSQEGGTLKTSATRDTFLVWNGPAGEKATIVFTQSPTAGKVCVEWNGKTEVVDLYSEREQQWAYEKTFTVPFYQNILTILIFGCTFACLVFFVLILLASVQYKERQTGRPASWWVYAIPMILVWGVYGLAFFPGILSPDTIGQWNQFTDWDFQDHHPVFHTLLLWLLTRVWDSPAFVSLCQITILALTAAWGIGCVQEMTGKTWVSWVISALFALSPVNGIMSIAIYKDIPYAIALLALVVILLEMVNSKGQWITGRFHWLGLSLVLFAVSIFRQNGLPVAFLTLLAVLLFYSSAWRRLALALLVSAGMWGLVHYPLYQALNVRYYPSLKSSFILHHIAAHLNHGDSLSPEQEAYLNTILPVEYWAPSYNYFRVDPLYFHEGIQYDAVDFKKSLKVAAALFMQDPQVDIDHTLCSGTAFWNVNPQRLYIPIFTEKADGELHWITENSYGIAESSLFPQLASRIYEIALVKYATPGPLYTHIILLWSPAIYTLLSVFGIFGGMLRQKNASLSLLLFPILIQTGLMVLVTISQDFRYQYAMYLMAPLCLGLIFVPGVNFLQKMK